jgi:hypothetical protein
MDKMMKINIFFNGMYNIVEKYEDYVIWILKNE